MKLSDFLELFDSIIYDKDFDYLSKVGDVYHNNSLTYIEDKRFVEEIRNNKNISAVITTKEFLDEFKNSNIGIVLSKNPKLAFIKINNKIKYLDNATKIGRNCRISSNAFISKNNVVIGDNVTIEENVKIFRGVYIGNNCTIKSGVILGSDGFEKCFDNDKNIYISKHNGKLVIGNNVIICEYSSIDKALLYGEKTAIGDNCYICKGVYIAHNTTIEKNVIIASNVQICGHVNIEEYVQIGSSSVISNRLTVGKNSKISLGSVVTKNVKDNEQVSGVFAIEHHKFIKFIKKISHD